MKMLCFFWLEKFPIQMGGFSGYSFTPEDVCHLFLQEWNKKYETINLLRYVYIYTHMFGHYLLQFLENIPLTFRQICRKFQRMLFGLMQCEKTHYISKHLKTR